MKLKSLFLLSLTAILPAMGMWNSTQELLQTNSFLSGITLLAGSILTYQCYDLYKKYKKNSTPKFYSTPSWLFREAIANNNEADVRRFLQSGISLEANLYGNTALGWATMHGHLNLVKFLVQSGASLSPQISSIKTPHEIAVTFNHHEIAMYLHNAQKNSSLN